MTTHVRNSPTDREAMAQLRLQLSQYLAQQPESTRAADRWMKRLEVASLAIYVITFLFALRLSINWESVSAMAIPAAWFLFVASAFPTMLLFGIHAILIQAFPTVVLPGKTGRFVTGRDAVLTGWLLVISSIVGMVVWGYLIYRILTGDYATLGMTLGVMIGVGITVTFVASIIRLFSRRG